MDDPLETVAAWLTQARELGGEPHAMTLATATRDGVPSARIVLLRGLDARGFVFFTNRESRKGDELRSNPQAALVLHWWELGRQVRAEGDVESVADSETEAYWSTRPRRSQLAAWASPQSRALADRAELDERVRETTARFTGMDVPLPPFWGGYRVVPRAIELWEHRENRLHDRLRFTRDGAAWRATRLAP